MRVAFTAAAAFPESALAARLVAQGHAVTGLVPTPEASRALTDLGGEGLVGDADEAEALRQLCEDADAVYHAAVPPLGAAAEGDPEVVVGVTSAVVAAAADAKVRRLVLQSHVGAVDDSERPRLQAKARAEAVVRASGVPWTILRPTLLFGEGDHVTALLVRLAREQPMVPVLGRGNALLQPLWVGDYGRVLLRCLEEPGFEGQVVDVGGPEHLTWDAFVDAVLRASGTSRPKLHIARGLANFLAQGMEWTMRAPPATRGELELLFRGQDLTDPDALERRFGFKPRPFRDALGYLRAPGLPRSDTDLGPPPEAGAPPGTPHGREPGRPGMRGP